MSVLVPYNRFIFSIMPQEPIILPPYKGSTFRGGFGNAFKKIACALKNRECGGCLLAEKCVYSYIFETSPPSDTRIMRKYKTIPHPFIIEPPDDRRRGFTPGNEISFGIILVGRATEYLPYFIYAYDELGEIGIGKGRGKFKLTRVTQTGINGKNGKTVYSADNKILETVNPLVHEIDGMIRASDSINKNKIRLNFRTPTRIIYNGRLTLDMDFHILIRNLIRRIALISYFHCGGSESDFNFNSIINEAKKIRTASSALRWYDWERYSARQNTRLKMGGFIGEIRYEGDVDPFLSILKAGEIMHIGKGTSFGLGKYEIG